MRKSDLSVEEKKLFDGAIDRLRRVGVDTTSYTDVVIALETEIQHCQNVMEGMESRFRISKDAETVYNDGFQSGILKGVRLFAARMIFTILENAAEGEPLDVNQVVGMIIYSCMDRDYFTEARDG